MRLALFCNSAARIGTLSPDPEAVSLVPRLPLVLAHVLEQAHMDEVTTYRALTRIGCDQSPRGKR